jgi:hypothetical protein
MPLSTPKRNILELKKRGRIGIGIGFECELLVVSVMSKVP